MRHFFLVLVAFSTAALFSACQQARPKSEPTPEDRAIAYLSREVPAWSPANKCFSCHNNGDAARALFTAIRVKQPVPEKTLDETVAWLVRPHQWHNNGGDVEYKDDGLARIQFGTALVEAMDVGLVNERQSREKAAELIAAGQTAEGTWQADFPGDIGSPVTYGKTLATAQARLVLAKTDPKKYEQAIARADDWFLRLPVQNVIDAAAVLLAIEGKESHQAKEQRERCLEVIRKGQAQDGGWGPYVNSMAEVFDTALVVLALGKAGAQQEGINMRRKGRAFLIAQQEADGSWPETTRPPGNESYAQRISTSAWATMALLSTTQP